MRTDRFTLTAITAVAVLAASLAVTLMPGGLISPPLTWAITYTATVLGTARLVDLPPARTLCAATLILGNAIGWALAGLRLAIDGALTLLTSLNTTGMALLTDKGVSA